jgi:hypothetical protein
MGAEAKEVAKGISPRVLLASRCHPKAAASDEQDDAQETAALDF